MPSSAGATTGSPFSTAGVWARIRRRHGKRPLPSSLLGSGSASLGTARSAPLVGRERHPFTPTKSANASPNRKSRRRHHSCLQPTSRSSARIIAAATTRATASHSAYTSPMTRARIRPPAPKPACAYPPQTASSARTLQPPHLAAVSSWTTRHHAILTTPVSATALLRIGLISRLTAGKSIVCTLSHPRRHRRHRRHPRRRLRRTR